MIVAGTFIHTTQGLIRVEDITTEHDIIGSGWIFSPPKLFRGTCKWLITDRGRIGVSTDNKTVPGDVFTVHQIPHNYERETTFLPFSNEYELTPTLAWFLGIVYGNMPQNARGCNICIDYYNIRPDQIDIILYFMNNVLEQPIDKMSKKRFMSKEWSDYLWVLFGDKLMVPDCICESNHKIQLAFLSGLMLSPMLDFSTRIISNKSFVKENLEEDEYKANPFMGNVFDQACALSCHTSLSMSSINSDEIKVLSVYEEPDIIMVDVDSTFILGPGIKISDIR